MAIRIPTIERQASIPGETYAPRQAPERAGAGAGQLADAAFSFAKQADAISDRIRQEQDIADVGRAVADARVHFIKVGRDLEASAPADGTGHEQRVQEAFDAWTGERLAQVSPTARPYLQTRLEGLRAGLIGRALEFQTALRVGARVRNFEETINGNLGAVYQDGRQYEAAIGDLTGQITATQDLPEYKKAELIQKMRERAAVALLNGMIDRKEFDVAKRRIDAGEFNAALGPEKLNMLRDQWQRGVDRARHEAEAAAARAKAAQAKEFRRKYADDLAAADALGTGAGQGGSFLVSDDQLRAVFDDRADELIEARADRVATYNINRQVAGMTRDQMDEVLREAAPAAGPGMAGRLKNWTRTVRAVTARRDELNKTEFDDVKRKLENDYAAAELTGQGAGEGGAWQVSDETLQRVLGDKQAADIIAARDEMKRFNQLGRDAAGMEPSDRAALARITAPEQGRGDFAGALKRYKNFLGVLDGLNRADATDAARAATAVDRANEAQARDEAQQRRQETDRRVADDLASFQRRGTGAGQNGERLVTYQDLVDVYGPATADKLEEEYRSQAEATANIRDLARTGAAGDQARLNARVPAGPGYAQRAAAEDRLVAAIADKRRALADDPAGWVIANVPEIASAFNAAIRPDGTIDEDLRASATQALLDEQERQGVPRPQQALLGKARAAAEVERLGGLDVDRRATELGTTLPRIYGASWPNVFAELQRAGLSGAEIAIPLVQDPKARVELTAALARPHAELLKAAGPDAKKDLDKDLPVLLDGLRRSLGRATDGSARYSGIATAVEKLALRYAGAGMSTSEAARKAYDEIVGQRYEFAPMSDGSYRVPRRPDLTPASTKVAVEFALSEMRPTDLADVAASRPGTKAGDDNAKLLDTLRRGGFVLTNNANDTGVLVLDRSGVPVETAKGKPLEILFSDVAGLNQLKDARDDLERAKARAEQDAAAARSRDMAAAALQREIDAARALAARQDEMGFARSFREVMTRPADPSKPWLDVNIDLLDIASRWLNLRDIYGLEPDEQKRALERIRQKDPQRARMLQERIDPAGARAAPLTDPPREPPLAQRLGGPR